VSSVPAGYNERLFAGRGLRSWLHNARFHWFRGVVDRLSIRGERVLEIGCFDAKLIDWLPGKPVHYVGVDANWEKGLDLARRRYAGDPGVVLIEAASPDFAAVDAGGFDLGVSMETLEHVPPEQVAGYLDRLANDVAGYLVITVPNEKGPVFAAKWLAKKLLYRDAEHYSLAEFANALLGRMARVGRNQHKGFDYADLIEQVQARCDVLLVEAIPFRRLPLALAFGVGIVARTRRA
jgi:cyclopropane fatty-acyl-phospholipid synthase-like methyltransferase